MHRVSLSYRGGDATQSRNGQAREGDQAEGDTEAQAATVRDTVVISHAAWGFRPTPVTVPLDEMVAPFSPRDEALFRIVEAVTSLFFGESLPLLTPGDLLRAPVPDGAETQATPGVGMVYQRYGSYRSKDEHVTFIPTLVRSPGEAVGATVLEVRLDTELMRTMKVTPENAQWNVDYGLSVDVPQGGWDQQIAHVTVRVDVDGIEDQVALLVDGLDTAGESTLNSHPLEPAGYVADGEAPGARRVRVWSGLNGGSERLVGLGVPGFGLVFVGSL